MRQRIILAALCFLLTVLNIKAGESAYYYVGWLNNWSTTDKSYPLTLQDDGLTWEVTIPAPDGVSGWFKIAPASAYGKDDFWNLLYCAPYDGCRELSGTMEYGNKGAWLLPDVVGAESFTIKIQPSTMQYLIVPNVGDPWSGTLPVLFIDTESEVNSKEVYVKGKYYIDALGLEGYQSLGTKENPLPLQIKGRGNWTWTGFNKKPYRLKFDSKASPLGMKSNKHFNLLANADDHNAFLNNTVGFQLSRLLKLAYTPEQRPVEVVLNGDYIGLYMLTDKIRVEKNRVNIVEQSDEETDPQNVTGGWLLEIDNYDEENQIRMTESNGYTLRFTYHTPEVLSDVQKNYITDFLKATDRAIYNTDKTSTEWEQYIDIDALARFYIVQEVMGDGESFHGSCYMSKDRGENTKLVFGPVWDFGNAFGCGTNRFIYVDPPFEQNWIGEIAKYPRFQQRVKAIWQPFLGDNYPQLDGFIDDFILQISDAAANDGRRWPEYSQSNINDRKNNFKNKISQKVNYLRQQWGNGISSIWTVPDDEADDDCWYGLDGRKINGVPTRHGLFIHKGRKVVL